MIKRLFLLSYVRRFVGSVTGVGADSWWFSLVAWIFILEYALYLVRPNLPDKLIKLGAFGCLAVLLLLRHREFGADEKKLLLLFLGLLVSALIPSLYMGDGVAILQWSKIAFMFSIFPLLLMRFRVAPNQAKLMAEIYLLVAAIFSIQAIIAFSLVIAGYFRIPDIVEIGRRPGQVANSLGLLGFANAVQNPIDCIRLLRVQGWFVEPSILSAFLLFPAFVSFAHYFKNRKTASLFLAVTISIALFMTFSLAGYLAVIVALLFLLLSGPLHVRLGAIPSLRYAYPIVIALGFLLLARGVLLVGNIVHEHNLEAIQSLEIERLEARRASAEVQEPSREGPASLNNCNAEPGMWGSQQFIISISKMFARNPEDKSGNLFREGYKFAGYKSVFQAYPFGMGLAHTQGTHEETSGSAILFWLVSGGFPAIILAVVLFWYVFWTYCHPLLTSGNIVLGSVAASFIGHAVHNLSYGFWLAPFFLLHLAIVVASAHRLCRNAVTDASTAGDGRRNAT